MKIDVRLLLVGLVVLLLPVVAVAAMHADGNGFFPVVVQVVDAKHGKPIKGAVVTLEDAGKFVDRELDPERRRVVLPAQLGKPVKTNVAGVATVFYFGPWGSFESEGVQTYSRSLRGTVVVKVEGIAVYRKALKDWAKEKKFEAAAHAAPHVVVEVE